ncbi:F-box domain containing protein [Nitzschia inconspicua]|uniref:F-box domain containing protein n=1 Tax=Nitzschia inconspicua TaxID=303405 RepID=A0A9K3L752_9STRA|nr:F-box domain containing protein [Nitzschia inconspicua]
MKVPVKRSEGSLPTINESEVPLPASSPSLKLRPDVATDADETNMVTNVSNDDDDGNDKDGIGSSPLWSGSMDGWHLSWPIWHMLPRDERRKIAHQHGYKSIGEFEEYMSLQQAVDYSEWKGNYEQKQYSVESVYPTLPSTSTVQEGEDKKLAAFEASVDDASNGRDEDSDDENYSESTSHHGEKVPYGRQESTSSSSNPNGLSVEELMAVGGRILMISDDLLHKVFSFLPVDTYGILALVSPHWKHLTRTEAVYRRLCERLYLNQSKRRQLQVSKFGGSYRRMLEIRPRVRAAGGCYVLKYAQIKQIQRDMWTEVPVGAILESIYYRYLYFQEDGRVLYALSSAPPHEMFRRLLKIILHKTKDPAAVWGTFQVQKTHLSITARQEWHTVRFDLTIYPDSEHGRFAALSIDRHLSSPSACFEEWSRDMVQYKVPPERFRFVRDPRL